MTQRKIFGSCLLLAGLALLVWQGVLASASAREWWRWRIADPSAAELYWIDLWFYAAGAVLGAVMAWVGKRLVSERSR